MRYFFLLNMLLLFVLSELCASEQKTFDLSNESQIYLGNHIKYYVEDKNKYSLSDILSNKYQKNALYGDFNAFGLGINHKPVWLHMKLNNPTKETLKRFISVNRSWIDYIDIFLVNNDNVIKEYKTGDMYVHPSHLNESIGYVFQFEFPSGVSEVVVRLETPDPMVIDFRLYTQDTLERDIMGEHYFSGFFYGSIFSLVLYNLILFFRLGRRIHLCYSIFLTAVVLTNFSYTGRGLFWLWGDAPDIQQYVILIFMVVSALTGIHFTKEFLELKKTSPLLTKVINGYIIVSILLLVIIVSLDWHSVAVWFAFIDLSIFIFAMVPIGIYSLFIERKKAAGYFLIAAIASMVGMSLTLLSSWGIIVINDFTTKGVEYGVMIEAILLALALTEFVRQQMLEKEIAKSTARTDPLTNLLNRRGFMEDANRIYQTAKRHNRPLSLIILDIDNFKSINDNYGHDIGDAVIQRIAHILEITTRSEDILGRWGGEEFVVLLPEVSSKSAVSAAERIRKNINSTMVQSKKIKLQFTSSFGVTELKEGYDIETLIKIADNALYKAKETGRDKVILGN